MLFEPYQDELEVIEREFGGFRVSDEGQTLSDFEIR